MHRTATQIVGSVLLLTFLGACATTPIAPPTVAEVRRDVCPRPLTRAERIRVADALDRLILIAAGDDLDLVASELERLNDGARICRGERGN